MKSSIYNYNSYEKQVNKAKEKLSKYIEELKQENNTDLEFKAIYMMEKYCVIDEF